MIFMNAKMRMWQFYLLVFFGVFLLLAVPKAQAAVIEFSPTSGSFAVNSKFDVQINVNTEEVDTTSTDAVINFDSSLLSVDSVSYGSFYETVLHSQESGKLFISGMVSNPGQIVNGTGTLATVSFKALTSGTATLSFACTAGKTDDSNVTKNDLDSTDVIDCSKLQSASFILSGSSSGDSTTTPSATLSPSPTNSLSFSSSDTDGAVGTINEIPRAGVFDFLSLAPKILMGVLFVIIGLIPLFI